MVAPRGFAPSTLLIIVIDFGTFMSTALLVALALLPLVPVVLMFLHAARTPGWVWAFTDHTQVVWVALLLAGIVITPVGLVLAAWYFFKIRPVLDARERGEL